MPFLRQINEDKIFILDYVFQYLFLSKYFPSDEEFKILRHMIKFTIYFITYFSFTHLVQNTFLLFFYHYCNHTF